jgi:hypothetical protein
MEASISFGMNIAKRRRHAGRDPGQLQRGHGLVAGAEMMTNDDIQKISEGRKC